MTRTTTTTRKPMKNKSIILALGLFFSLASLALAREIPLAWDPNPTVEEVDGYRVKAKGPGEDTFTLVAETTLPNATIDLGPGKWILHVTAVKAHQNPPLEDGTPGDVVELESAPSAELALVIPGAPTGLKLVQ